MQFTHPLCTDCHTLERELVAAGRDVFTVDVSRRPELARKYGVALVPMASKSVLEWYDAVELPANIYAWQTTPVATVAVKAVLVSFEFEGRLCESVGRFAQQVAAGRDWLTKHGHPKWERVDLGYQLKGWSRSECVRQ